MDHIRNLATASTHQLYRGLLVLAGRGDHGDDAAEPSTDGPAEGATRDRGAVSLEQVLWFVAAGVSVALIASILWNQIRTEAETPVQSPSSP